jgi:hypothetical protein
VYALVARTTLLASTIPLFVWTFQLWLKGVRERTGVWVCKFSVEDERRRDQIEVTSLYGHNLAALLVTTAPFASGTFNPTACISSVVEITLHNFAISGLVVCSVATAV